MSAQPSAETNIAAVMSQLRGADIIARDRIGDLSVPLSRLQLSHIESRAALGSYMRICSTASAAHLQPKLRDGKLDIFNIEE